MDCYILKWEQNLPPDLRSTWKEIQTSVRSSSISSISCQCHCVQGHFFDTQDTELVMKTAVCRYKYIDIHDLWMRLLFKMFSGVLTSESFSDWHSLVGLYSTFIHNFLFNTTLYTWQKLSYMTLLQFISQVHQLTWFFIRRAGNLTNVLSVAQNKCFHE